MYKKVVNNAEEVLLKARRSLDSPGYNAFLNNCEHFCTWCKINKRASSQIEYLELWILKFLPACHLRLLADVVMVARNGLPQSLAKGIVVGALKCVVNAFGMVFEFVAIAIELAILGQKSENGEINDEEYYEAVTKKLCSGYFMSVFCMIGHMIIPIPVVGCIVGTIVGLVIGYVTNCIVFTRPSPWARLKSVIKRVWELAIK